MESEPIGLNLIHSVRPFSSRFLIVDIVTSIIYSCLYTIIQIKIDLYIYTYLEVLMYNVFFIKLFVVNTNTSVKSRLDFLGW